MHHKWLNLFFLTLFSFILNLSICYADTYRGKITGTGVNLRSGPGTNYSSIKTLSKNSEYTLVSNKLYPSEKSCSKGWYQMYYEASATGYVCADYVSVSTLVFNENATTNCEQNMQAAGFPSSYWPGLCKMQQDHPSWQFKAIATGLDWVTAVNKESACGESYVASSDPANIDTSCKNPYSKTWYPASASAVAYYMDPRNWLTDNAVFQFEYLKYDNGLASSYASAASDLIDHSEFYKYHYAKGTNLGDVMNDVGKELDVSPVHIASRVLQELGAKNTLYNLYSGVYPGYEGYYNFYNFGVSDSCATSNGTTVCGLTYAKNNGWYGLYEAIKGGADQISRNYIAKGQYTIYLQKFNVVPTESNKLYGHQYMTNLSSPSEEAKSSYKTYNNAGLINSPFVFYIPVYNNMNNTNYYSSNGAVDSNDLTDPSKLAISTIVTSSGYTYQSGKISGISANTSISQIKSTIESISGSNTVVVKNNKGNLVVDGNIGTGYTVTVNNSTTNETLTAIVKGDTSGDGEVNALDLLQVQKKLLGTYTLNDVYDTAGDTSGDGEVNALDLLQIQKKILGTYEIK